MALIYGQLEKAQLEMLSAEPASAPLGYVFMDTSEGVVKVKTAAGFVRVQGLTGTAKIITTDSDPSAGSGLAAPIGSLALNQTNGSAYSKNGAADTAWVQWSTPGDALLKTGGTMSGAIDLGNNALTGVSSLAAGSISGFTASGNIGFSGNYGHVIPSGDAAGKLVGFEFWDTGPREYTPGNHVRLIVVELWGGGGGGGSCTADSDACRSGGGGGGGGYRSFMFKNVHQITGANRNAYIVIGGGGGANGAGNPSSITFDGVVITCNGGGGGSSAVNSYFAVGSGGAGGTTGQTGSSTRHKSIVSLNGHPGGDSLAYYIGYPTAGYFALSGPGGTSGLYPTHPAQMAGNTTGNVGVDGVNGYTHGCGGSGSSLAWSTTARSGGTGFRGAIRIYEYA